MNPKLSILVPIYNVESYLPQCLQSLVNQSLPEIEIICVNDGSTDNSLKIIKDFMQNDARITCISKKNSGYGDSMNRALKEARGEYITILESDDWIDKDAYAEMYRAAEEVRADVVKANFFRFRTKKNGAPEDAKVTEITSQKVINPKEDREVFKFAPAIWSAIYRRDFLKKNKIDFLPTPGASYQDLSFNFKVWALARKVVLLPKAYVHYRVDNEGSSINNPGKVNCVVDEYAEIETFLTERGIFADFGETMNEAKFRNYHWNFQRLNSKLAKEFYQTWRGELLSASDEGLLNREHFSKKDWLALRAIIRHPHLAYHILRLRIWWKNLTRSKG